MNKIKQFVRHVMPKSLWLLLRRARFWYRTKRTFQYDRKRYFKYFARSDIRESQENIEAHIIFHTHQIEKGLSHAEFRSGFGKDVLKKLRLQMEKLRNHDSVAYIAGLSAIKAYVDVHEKNRYDISEQKKIIGERLLAEAMACKSDISGYFVIDKRSKENNKTKNFKDLFMNRYSVREFSNEPVDDKKIRRALEISLKTPTICNRQSFRVMIIKNREKIKEVLQIQNGFRDYDPPPVLVLILTDTRFFRGVEERNNVYIDGGSFMMSFLLGLEYEGLAACPLNTIFKVDEEKKTRQILGIADNYNFISYVAIGNFRKKNKVAKSFRFPVDDIIIEVK
jgi:nitroreductase